MKGIIKIINNSFPELFNEKKIKFEDNLSKFFKNLAFKFWEAPYENYSSLLMHSKQNLAEDIIKRISKGDGGSCIEKVYAFSEILKEFGVRHEVILSGRAPPPYPKNINYQLNLLKRFLKNNLSLYEKKKIMDYHEHVALKIYFNNRFHFVDFTGGNIPFIYLNFKLSKKMLNYNYYNSYRLSKGNKIYYYEVNQKIVNFLYKKYLCNDKIIKNNCLYSGIYINEKYSIKLKIMCQKNFLNFYKNVFPSIKKKIFQSLGSKKLNKIINSYNILQEYFFKFNLALFFENKKFEFKRKIIFQKKI